MAHFSFCFAALMYAIIGGPSSGKTSIIKELEKRGEPVIYEAATDWIHRKLRLGVAEPWKERSFTLDILKLQLEREKPFLSMGGRVFIDRGIFDIYAFGMAHGLAGSQALVSANEILNRIDLNERYKAIFFIMPHSANFSSLQTEVRHENTHEAAQLEAATYAIYCRHDNFIVVPGELTPQERADFILEKIRKIE